MAQCVMGRKCVNGGSVDSSDLMGMTVHQYVTYHAKEAGFGRSDIRLERIPDGRACSDCRDSGILNTLVRICTS